MLRQFAAHLGVPHLAHLGVELELLGGLVRVVVLHQQALRSGAVTQRGLDAEISTEGDEAVENCIIPHLPRSEAGEEDQCREDRVAQRLRPLPCADQNPKPADGKEEQEARVRQRDHSPQQGEDDPACGEGILLHRGLVSSDAAHTKRQQNDPREQAGGQGHLPEPAHGVLQRRRIQRPDPPGPDGIPPREAAVADLPDGHRRRSGEEAVDDQNDPRRERRIDSKEFEGACQQQRVEWRQPCRRPRLPAKRACVAIAADQRPRNAASLPSEGEVIVVGAHSIGVGQRDVKDAEEEGYPEQSPRRAKIACSAGVFSQHPRPEAMKHRGFDFSVTDGFSIRRCLLFVSSPAMIAEAIFVQEKELRMSQSVRIKVKKLVEGAQLPRYAHVGEYGDLAADLYASEGLILEPGSTVLVPTGIAMEFPSTHGALVEDRSGLAVKAITTLAGVIDPGYRGEIKVVVTNLGASACEIKTGDRIAQLRIVQRIQADFDLVEELGEATRGAGGFGSTGI